MKVLDEAMEHNLTEAFKRAKSGPKE
jgi:hypothetical protein